MAGFVIQMGLGFLLMGTFHFCYFRFPHNFLTHIFQLMTGLSLILIWRWSVSLIGILTLISFLNKSDMHLKYQDNFLLDFLILALFSWVSSSFCPFYNAKTLWILCASLCLPLPLRFSVYDLFPTHEPDEKNVLRGTRVVRRKVEFVLTRLEKKERQRGDPPGLFCWGQCRLPRSRETHHLLIVGSPGSGKTQLTYPLLEQVLARGDKAIVWDVKGTYIQALCHRPNVQLLAPWDARSIAWQPGADILHPLDCQQAAAILIPKNHRDPQPFFSNAARQILEAVLIQLDAAGSSWGWADLFNGVAQGKEQLGTFLQGSSEGRAAASLILGDSKGSQDIYSTLLTSVQTVRWLAKAWPGDGVSLRQWIREKRGVALLLGGVPEREELATSTANLAIQIMMNEVLSLPDDLNRRIWFFLDELATLGRMDALLQAFALGRSKGLCVVAGIQDIGKIEYLYGRELAKSISNTFSTNIFLRSSDFATSQWASDVIGQQEVVEFHHSTSEGFSENRAIDHGSSGSSQTSTLQQTIRIKPAFLASQISNFPNITGVLRVSGWPAMYLRWPLRPIPQQEPLIVEANWVSQKATLDGGGSPHGVPTPKISIPLHSPPWNV